MLQYTDMPNWDRSIASYCSGNKPTPSPPKALPGRGSKAGLKKTAEVEPI